MESNEEKIKEVIAEVINEGTTESKESDISKMETTEFIENFE